MKETLNLGTCIYACGVSFWPHVMGHVEGDCLGQGKQVRSKKVLSRDSCSNGGVHPFSIVFHTILLNSEIVAAIGVLNCILRSENSVS